MDRTQFIAACVKFIRAALMTALTQQIGSVFANFWSFFPVVVFLPLNSYQVFVCSWPSSQTASLIYARDESPAAWNWNLPACLSMMSTRIAAQNQSKPSGDTRMISQQSITRVTKFNNRLTGPIGCAHCGAVRAWLILLYLMFNSHTQKTHLIMLKVDDLRINCWSNVSALIDNFMGVWLLFSIQFLRSMKKVWGAPSTGSDSTLARINLAR